MHSSNFVFSLGEAQPFPNVEHAKLESFKLLCNYKNSNYLLFGEIGERSHQI